jgi:putative transposase
MVEHPAEYPWSSYHNNALDKQIALLTPHLCYLALGNTLSKRRKTYQTLFEKHISALSLTEIRDATNKSWVLGDNRFKQQIEKQTGRRASPLPRGGDKKSKAYKDMIDDQ